MSVRSAQIVVIEFTTRAWATGVGTNADSLPVGTLVVNGVDNVAVVTVTNIDTGRYKASVTMPTLAIGDIVELVVAATVAGVSDKAVVWRDTKDILLDASGDVTVGTNADKAGYALSPTGADLILVDGKTLPVAIRAIAAVVAGKISGAGTGTEIFLGLDGITARVTVTVDGSGNRTAVVYG